MHWPNCGDALGQNWDGVDDIINVRVVNKDYDENGPLVVFEKENL